MPARILYALTILTLPIGAFAGDRYAEITSRVKALEQSSLAHVLQIGASAKGRPIFAVLLANSEQRADTRVLVISGQHGDEVSPVYAMLDLAEDIARNRDPHLAGLLKDTSIFIVPVANPDGFAAYQRSSSSGADLNRGWRAAVQPEIRSVRSLVERVKPQVVIDLHEWMDRDPRHANCVEVAGFGTSPQCKLARLLAAFSRHEMSRRSGSGDGMRTVFYRKDADARLAHRHFSNLGMCGMLVETASGQPREARMRIYREFVTAAIHTLSRSGDPRIIAQLSAVSKHMGEADLAFAQIERPTPAPIAGVGEIACWIVMLAATVYVVMRGPGSKEKKTSCEGLVLGRQVYRIPLTEVVRANLPPRVRVALIQQQRTRPSDRVKQIGAGRAVGSV